MPYAMPTTDDHGSLQGLGDDDHVQYVLIIGRAGGQTIFGGTGSGESLDLRPTGHPTKGKITFSAVSAYDSTNERLGIGTSSPTTTGHFKSSGATYVTIDSSGANNLDRGIRFNSQSGAAAGYVIIVPGTVGTDTRFVVFVGGSASADIKLVVDDNGKVGIGNVGTLVPAYTLDADITATQPAATNPVVRIRNIATLNANSSVTGLAAGLTIESVLNQSTFNSTSASHGVSGLNLSVSGSGSSGTISKLAALVIDRSNTAGGTITNSDAIVVPTHTNTGGGVVGINRSFVVQSQNVGTTGIQGFVGEIGAGTDRHNIYISGAAPVYFQGNVGIGGNSITPTARLDITGSLTTAAQVRLQSNSNVPASPNDGDIWHYSTQKTIVKFLAGIAQYEHRLLYSGTAQKSVTNTTTITTLFPASGIGSTTLPANFWVPGKFVEVEILGYLKTKAEPPGSLVVDFKVGANVTISTPSIDLPPDIGIPTSSPNNTYEGQFKVCVKMLCRTLGASGSFVIYGEFEFYEFGSQGGSGTQIKHFHGMINQNGPAFTVDTTASHALDVRVAMGTADTANGVISDIQSIKVGM